LREGGGALQDRREAQTVVAGEGGAFEVTSFSASFPDSSSSRNRPIYKMRKGFRVKGQVRAR